MPTFAGIGLMVIGVVLFIARREVADWFFTSNRISPFIVGRPPGPRYYLWLASAVAIGLFVSGFMGLLTR
jgi:hypothetical protein